MRTEYKAKLLAEGFMKFRVLLYADDICYHSKIYSIFDLIKWITNP